MSNWIDVSDKNEYAKIINISGYDKIIRNGPYQISFENKEKFGSSDMFFFKTAKRCDEVIKEILVALK